MRLLRRKTKKHGLDTSRDLPVHIAVIMDGNGRWAARRSMM